MMVWWEQKASLYEKKQPKTMIREPMGSMSERKGFLLANNCVVWASHEQKATIVENFDLEMCHQNSCTKYKIYSETSSYAGCRTSTWEDKMNKEAWKLLRLFCTNQEKLCQRSNRPQFVRWWLFHFCGTSFETQILRSTIKGYSTSDNISLSAASAQIRTEKSSLLD